MHRTHILVAIVLISLGSGCDDSSPDADGDLDADVAEDGDVESDADQEGDADVEEEEPPQPCESDEDCDNWHFCDGVERCVGGFCESGEPPSCDDGDDCTNDSCSNARMECVHNLRVIDDDGDGFGSVECYGPDCDDDNEAINPEARELCNDFDDNCDDRVDEPGPVLITAESQWPGEPVIVEGESGQALVWSDERELDREIYFALYDDESNLPSVERRVTDSTGFSNFPDAVWTGSEYVIVWSDDRDGEMSLYFQRLSGDGGLSGEAVKIVGISGTALYPSLVWTGAELLLVWSEQVGDAFGLSFTRLSLDGELVGEIRPVTTGQQASTETDVVWTGESLAVAWFDQRVDSGEIYFTRLSAAGDVLGAEQQLTAGAMLASPPTLAWTGSDYAVLWSDQRDGDYDVRMVRLSSEGEVLAGPIDVISNESWAQGPEVAWSGSELQLVFRDDRDGADETYWARLGLDGELLGESVRISTAEGWTSDPEVAWSDGRVSIIWAELGDGYGLYFARSCP